MSVSVLINRDLELQLIEKIKPKKFRVFSLYSFDFQLQCHKYITNRLGIFHATT